MVAGRLRMLESSYSEWGMGQPPVYAVRSLAALHALVDRLAAAPTVSSRGAGASGDHAWISVIDRGFIAHAYFGEETRRDGVISFELYGPYSPGTERDDGDPYDGRGLAGSMTTAQLKVMLSLLDAGQSPVEYVRETALSVSVVTDD
jgi:hypothetical protein